MLPVLQSLWEAKKRRNLFDKQTKEVELEKLKKSVRPALIEIIQQSVNNSDIEKPVAYGKKADTYFMTEGKITGININNGTGTIENNLTFNDASAGRLFNELKVDVKVKYSAYCDDAKRVQIKIIEGIVEDAWEEEAANDVEEAPRCEEFFIDLRSYLGKVIEIQNYTYTVESDSNQEEDIVFDLNNIKNNGFEPKIGDLLNMSAKYKIDDSFVNSCGNVVEVLSIKPMRTQKLYGRVTTIHHDHVVIDDSTYYLKTIPEPLSLNLGDEIEIERIECQHKQFNWRATKVFEQVKKNQQNKVNHKNSEMTTHDINYDEDDNKDIIVPNTTFKFEQNESRESVKFIQILNKSSNDYTISKCTINCDESFCLISSNVKPPFFMRKKTGRYQVYFKIHPKEVGTMVVELIVDFESFQKRSNLTIIVNERQRYSSCKSNHFTNVRVIPGQKLKNTPRFIEIRFDDYAIPLKLREIDFSKHRKIVIDDLRLMNNIQLFQELSPNTYKKRMRYCLFFEEIAMELAFAGYSIERAHFDNITYEKDEYLKLEVKDVNEKRPSIAIGDCIQASSPFKYNIDKATIFEGNIHKILSDAILVKFHPDFLLNHKNLDYKIDFKFSRSGYRRQHHALDVVLDKVGLGLEFLFPIMLNDKPQHELPQVDVEINNKGFLKYRCFDREMPWFNKRLNEYQKLAVVNVLRGECRPLPYIIFGPPGTGKTMTLIETILQISTLVEDSRIIVATPSNSAADLITNLLIASGRFNTGDFIRFVSYIQFEKDRIPEDMKKHCATINISADNGNQANDIVVNESGLKLNVPKSFIGKHKVYISTLAALGPLMHLKFKRNHFTHVIIDEAGQAVETETMIPFSFLNNNHAQVILAGDPKQLGPVITSNISKEFQFERSFLERLSHHPFYLKNYGPNHNEYDERFLTKLRKNYRSLSSIMKMYNELYYDGELEAVVKDESSIESMVLSSLGNILWNRAAAVDKCGVYFHNVNGLNARTSESPSWFNEAEAGKIGVFLSNLLNNKVSPTDIGIITPYAQQVKIIRNLLNKFGESGESGVKVGTVEEFQGQEKSIILVSTVRTCSKLVSIDSKFGLGFLQCPKRMNVAISRARSLLVVFGKENVLTADPNWQFLIEYTKANNTFVS